MADYTSPVLGKFCASVETKSSNVVCKWCQNYVWELKILSRYCFILIFVLLKVVPQTILGSLAESFCSKPYLIKSSKFKVNRFVSTSVLLGFLTSLEQNSLYYVDHIEYKNINLFQDSKNNFHIETKISFQNMLAKLHPNKFIQTSKSISIVLGTCPELTLVRLVLITNDRRTEGHPSFAVLKTPRDIQFMRD